MHHFKPTETLKELSEALDTIKDQVDEVFDPILVIQAENDNMIDPQSANYIYEHVDSDEKISNGIVSQDMLLQLIKKKNKFSMIFINFRVIRLVRIKRDFNIRKEGHNEFKAINRRDY